MTWLLRLALLFIAVTGCFTALLVIYGRWQDALQRGSIHVEAGNPNLNPAERVYLQTYLAMRIDQLQQPAGTGSTPVPFVVTPGETADTIANNLIAARLLADRELFVNYVRYYGLDSRLEAGNFTLDPQSTIPELAAALTRAVGQEVELRFLEGWRAAEMARYLAVTTPAQIDPAEFLAIVERQAAFDAGRYDFLAALPAEASLEGFLFPDTYRVPVEAHAADLVDMMLANFGRRVTPEMRQAYGAQGLSLREAVTLASIVEREAVLPVERPVMAGVFLNRLAQGIPLQADPTVQYALGYQPDSDSWWKAGLTLEDLQVASPYNTYVVPGLPPTPIANPGLSSLEAVANPDETDFLYFVVDCTAAVAGTHSFSRTYDEHLANVQRCR